jgi:carboxyl-terminal processing protease
MTTTLDRVLKSILMILLAIVGAVFFYTAGLGTGIYAVRSGGRQPGLAAPPAATQTPLPGTVPSPTPANAVAPGDEQDSFGVFWEALGILQDEFYGDLPSGSELPYAAIDGVIAATGDPYTAFLDPVQAEIMRTDLSGSFEGIGATVRLRADGKLEIVQPIAGQPAIEAGLRANDVILAVDDVQLEGMNLYEAISLIRGPAGTVVHLLVERPGVDQPLEIEVERARIEMPTVESKMLDDNIGYLRLTEFGQTATDEVVKALRELNVRDLRGLILDLRGNRGGYLSTSIEVTSQFVGQGPIVIERFQDGREQRHQALPGGLATTVPLVVLVDGGSASAAEITAGAIQDTGRGVLIGTTTLGKGSVQMAHTLSDGSQLRVTVAHWFTPNGRAIHGEGLTPDIEVTITEDEIAAGQDPQLERAIAYLLEGE